MRLCSICIEISLIIKSPAKAIWGWNNSISSSLVTIRSLRIFSLYFRCFASFGYHHQLWWAYGGMRASQQFSSTRQWQSISFFGKLALQIFSDAFSMFWNYLVMEHLRSLSGCLHLSCHWPVCIGSLSRPGNLRIWMERERKSLWCHAVRRDQRKLEK